MAVRSALKSPMPHPVLAIRPVTERLIASSTDAQVEPRRDELAGAIESGELLRALHDLRVQPHVPDGGGQRARHLHQHLHVRLREGAQLVVNGIEGADHVALGEEGNHDRGADAPPRHDLPAHGRNGGIRQVVHSSGRPALRHPGRERVGRGEAQVAPLGQPGAGGHVEDAHLVALAVEQGDAQRVEAHEPAHRLGYRVVDVLG